MRICKILKLICLLISLSIYLLAEGVVCSYAQLAGSQEGEIVVTADAHSRSEATHVLVTVLVEATGANATESYLALSKKAASIIGSIEALGISTEISTRGEDYSSAADKSGAISSGSAVRAKRYLGVRIGNLNKTSEIIDKALKAGATAVTDVEYLTDSGGKTHLAAVDEATEKAKVKADFVARSLGVSLGSVISATVTEEPAGLILRKKMQRGVDVSKFSERETNVYVTVRFQVVHTPREKVDGS